MRFPMLRAVCVAGLIAQVAAGSATVAAQSTRVGNPKPPAPSPSRIGTPDQESAKAASRGAGQDPNIKATREQVLVNKPTIPVPPAKSGERARDAANPGNGYCDIVVDNWSGNYADIYVDGSWKGTVSPYGDGATWAVSGPTVLYAKADDGGTWGPYRVTCRDLYTWKLRP